MTHDELLDRIAKLSVTPETNVVPTELCCALIAVLEHLKDWRDWEETWKGHMSMSILGEAERNARYKVVQELTAIIEKELG